MGRKWEPVTPFGIVSLLGAIAAIDIRQVFQTLNPARTLAPERQAKQQTLPVKNQQARRLRGVERVREAVSAL
jgi:hypothetical protein